MQLTDRTRARISPVVGQTLSKTSPEPFHSPSYTPGNSLEVEMSREDSMAEALLDRLLRVMDTARSVEIVFLDTIIVAKRAESRSMLLGRYSRSDFFLHRGSGPGVKRQALGRRNGKKGNRCRSHTCPN